MSDQEYILGWLFINLETKTAMFVSKDARSDYTGLPWKLLVDKEILRAFRRDFAFKEVEIGEFLRFKIEIEEQSLKKWFDIREELL